MRYIDVKCRQEALEWLLKNFKSFKTLSLAGLPNLVEEINSNFSALEQLTNLDLSSCELHAFPKLSHLSKLQTLNLNDNEIENLNKIGLNSIRELKIAENPIEEVNWEENDLDCLKALHIGSDTTKFIGHKVLKRKLENKLDIYVADGYKDTLLCPTHLILNNNDELDRYLKCSEAVLGELKRSDTMYAFQWLVERSQVKFDQLNIFLRDELFVNDNFEKSMNILDGDQLSNLRKLSLQFCELKSIPPVKNLPVLEELDLSFNHIMECSHNLQLPNLKLLDLTRNSIKRIEVDVGDSIPALETLLCGSCVTKYISLHISKLVASKALTVIIPEEFHNVLLLPTYKIFKDSEELNKFVKNPDQAVTNVDYAYQKRGKT